MTKWPERPRRRAAIAGVHVTQQGDLADRVQGQVWFEAARGACADAGIPFDEVDGVVGETPLGVGIRDKLPGAALGHDLNVRPLRFHARTSIGAGSGGAGLGLAILAVENGLADTVVVATASAGEMTGYGSADKDAAFRAMAMLGGPYEYVHGTTRVSDFAVLARRHMHEFGTTSEQLAQVAVDQRLGATLHPGSLYGHRGEITVDDVLSSRMIADPLHLLDCCAINQGGGAFVVTTLERAQRGSHAPVLMLGYGEAHNYIDPNALPSLTVFEGSRAAADTAFAQAGVSREDVDVAGIGDHFTINVLLGLEAAGFCGIGEGGAFVQSGATGRRGSLPTNTAGGFLSFSHAGQAGVFTLIEVVEQLRGTAGARQTPGAEVGFVDGIGGAMQSGFAAVLARA